MTKEELEKKATEWIKNYSGLIVSYKIVKYDYDSLKLAFLAGVKELEKENQQLKAQIKKMRICENCKHSYHDRYHTLQCMYNCFNFDKWELAE